MRPIAPLTGLAGLLLFTACTTTEVVSLPKVGYGRRLDRVYVLVSPGPAGSLDFVDQLKASLESRFAAQRVACQVRVREVLAFDQEARIQADVAAFKPTHRLDIRQTAKALAGAQPGTAFPASSGGATFDLTLSEADGGEVVWRAILNCTGTSGVGSPGASAAEICRALAKDGLLGPSVDSK